jgi:hypothetical protein
MGAFYFVEVEAVTPAGVRLFDCCPGVFCKLKNKTGNNYRCGIVVINDPQ